MWRRKRKTCRKLQSDDIVNVIYMHTDGLKISGNPVLGMLTRPLPLPGPWGLPGPYQIFPGTKLKTNLLWFGC